MRRPRSARNEHANAFGEYARWLPNATIYPDAPGIDWAALEASASDFDVVVLVNPNTSTGTTLRTYDIYELARRTPTTLFWVDESFLAFSDEQSIVRQLEVEPLANVVVLVSLSKSLGVPGLRLGYLYASDESVISAVGEELPVWNLSSPAEYLLELMLKFGPAYDRSLALTRRDRDHLREQLLNESFVRSVPESGGNFLLVELASTNPEAATRVRDALLMNHDLEVKNVTEKFADRLPSLRVACRTSDENQVLVDALRSVTAAL